MEKAQILTSPQSVLSSPNISGAPSQFALIIFTLDNPLEKTYIRFVKK